MKLRFVLGAVLLLPVWLFAQLHCSAPSRAPARVESASASAPPAAVPTATATANPELFASTVRPILVGHCAPCHEPGGVMYERLPFDHPEVIASHSAGVLRRIKAPDERAAIERWLGSAAGGGTPRF